jgi:hypothetical protein
MSRVLSLAGFQVTIIGRFWVTAEAGKADILWPVRYGTDLLTALAHPCEGTNAAYAHADFQKHGPRRGGRRSNHDGLERSIAKESSRTTFARNVDGSGQFSEAGTKRYLNL